MADESLLWDWLRRAEPIYGNRLHMGRVENIVTKSYPDVEGVIFGHNASVAGAFQLETKMLHNIRKTTDSGEIRFEVGQREWGFKRWMAGGCSYALVGAKDRVWLIPGAFLLSLPLRGLVSFTELSCRCILAGYMGREDPIPPARDARTLAILMSEVLAHPATARIAAGRLSRATPGIDYGELNPLLAMIASDAGRPVTSRDRFRAQGEK